MSLTFRKLEKGDFGRGFLQLLARLTTVGPITREEFEKHFDTREANPDMLTVVGVCDGQLACTASLLIELKYVHHCGKIGHIEDVVVASDFSRRGFGKQIITRLIDTAKREKCYKVILDCNDQNVPFYESCGMKRHANEMAVYFE
jgi:glucosamine-phosphate N-acetyltransferase